MHDHHAGGHLHIPKQLARVLHLTMVPVIIATAVGMAALWPSGHGPELSNLFGGNQHLVDATVTSVESAPCQGSPPEAADLCQQAHVQLRGGIDKGKSVGLEAGGSSTSPKLHVGDRVLVGADDQGGGHRLYYFADFNRTVPLIVLVGLFVGAAIVFGRASGLRALLALAASLLALIWFVIPAVLHGGSPIEVAIVGSAFIMLVVLYVTGGLNIQTTVAVLGTMVSLALIAALAWIFVQATKLTGLADEDAVFLASAASNINLQGLMLGGIIIGSLGVLDDMTVTQVSAVWELRRANDTYDARALYRAAERVGRDHIASTVNTLVLAYAGASLPLLIYFTQSQLHLRQILTSEVIAVELVRTLVGSIGLIASVPITTALAAYVVTRPNVEAEPDDAPADDSDEDTPLTSGASSVSTRMNRRLTAINNRARRALHTAAREPRSEPQPQPWEPPKKERDFWGDAE